MLVEPSAVFFETGEIASFSKADGSISSSTRGHKEAAETDHPSGETRRASNNWHLTVQTVDTSGDGFNARDFEEDDKVTFDGLEYTILDRFGDDTITTFLLDDPTL